MNATDKAKLTTLIGGMAETYRRDISVAGIQGYLLGLSDLPIENISEAVGKALRTSKWMPTVSELRGFAGVKTPEQEAAAAWETLCEGISRVGLRESIDFTDRRINAAVRHVGGWERVNSRGGDDFHVWLKKEFIADFTSIAERGLSCAAEYPLLGLTAKENGNRWPEFTPPPVLFGPETDQPRIAHKRPQLPRVELKKVTERKAIER